MTALEAAKQAVTLPDLMAQLGLGEHAKKSARCPFHEDRNRSFSVFQAPSGEWAWNCFAGCGGGDTAAFLARAANISNSEACRRLIETSGAVAQPGRPPMASASRKSVAQADRGGSGLPIPMSASENEQALAMATTLRDNLPLCGRIARSRGWQVETVVDLTHEQSLGWHEGKLAFLYESGTKLRWRENGERVIRWAFGKPWLWRGGFLCGRTTIYLCEGETDAISLIDAGIEKDERSLAVGLPSATTFNAEWAQLFRGKDVVLALDGDQAGQESTTRISRLLQPVAKTLRQLNWRGLQHAS